MASARAATLAAVLALCTGATAGRTTADPPQFPAQFVVTTGITIPFDGADPVAQSGSIHFDLEAQRLRIDTSWLGHQRTFIADLKAQRGYMVNNLQCAASVLTGRLLPMGVPGAEPPADREERRRQRGEDASSEADGDAEELGGSPGSRGGSRRRNTATFKMAKADDQAFVRGVMVDHFVSEEVVDRAVLAVDYYVKRVNFTTVLPDRDVPLTFFVPWRVTSRRTARKALAAPQPTRPNWKFYDEPLIFDDEVVPYDSRRTGGQATSQDLASLLTDDISVTVDYYNLVPMRPDPSVFEPPGQCSHPPTETFAHDIDAFDAQHQLTVLAFNNEQGRRLVGELRREASRKRITDQPAGANDDL